ncbi:MAG: TlpA disulfide reductase family protein [Balneolaceae bacterium]|jgi:thiol-disulfide isomerase/thioredoxin
MVEKKSTNTNKWKRWLIEYSVIMGIILLLYSTGYYVEVVGRLQQIVLWTGIIQPDLEQPVDIHPAADLKMPMISLSGEKTNLYDYRGKIIFLNFWATWCPPCVAEMPDIQSLYQSYKDQQNITFLMVSVDQDADKAKQFIRRKGFTFPVFIINGLPPAALRPSVIPSTFVIGKDGHLVLRRRGMAKYNTERFKTFLDSLMATH